MYHLHIIFKGPVVNGICHSVNGGLRIFTSIVSRNPIFLTPSPRPLFWSLLEGKFCFEYFSILSWIVDIDELHPRNRWREGILDMSRTFLSPRIWATKFEITIFLIFKKILILKEPLQKMFLRIFWLIINSPSPPRELNTSAHTRLRDLKTSIEKCKLGETLAIWEYFLLLRGVLKKLYRRGGLSLSRV